MIDGPRRRLLADRELLSGFVRAGHNRADGRLLYDGILPSGQGGRCAQMTDISPGYTLTGQCFGPTPRIRAR